MGIRDTSYYGWNNIFEFHPVRLGSAVSASFTDIAIDSSGSIYVTGWVVVKTPDFEQWVVYKSIDDGQNWSEVYASSSDNGFNRGLAIGVDSQDRIYVVGSTVRSSDGELDILSSSDGGATWGRQIDITTFQLDGDVNNRKDFLVGIDFSKGVTSSPNEIFIGTPVGVVRSSDFGDTWAFSSLAAPDETRNGNIIVASNDTVYWTGGGGGQKLEVNNSTNSGSTWTDITPTALFDGSYMGPLAVDSNDNLYTAANGRVFGDAVDQWLIHSTSDGFSTFGSSSFAPTGEASEEWVTSLFVDSKDSVYAFGSRNSDGNPGAPGMVMRKDVFIGDSWFLVDFQSGSLFLGSTIDNEDNIYSVGRKDNKIAFVRKGKLTANSASIGPRMLATSIGYVKSEISGTTEEAFKLGNITEFPHAGGTFQMSNMVLGTVDSGQIGRSEDSIIQVSHLGSEVHIMWPKQDTNINSFVQGFGSFSPGQRPGKLTTDFAVGSFFDVTEWDHLALYGFVTKAVSGTLDYVEVRVERRPLRDTGFAVDQAVEYTTSGSEVIATYRDLIHAKEVNYGDSSIREIGWPIDIPLTNVKELRISARHRNGQSEDKNKNFIMWGRLIKSDEET